MMNSKAIRYSQAELDWLSENRTLPNKDYHATFTKAFNRPDVSAANLHALRKRKGWKTGRTGRFVKGNIPHPNARSKGPNKTSFKKGQMPHNWHPIGHERVTSEGYLQRKLQDTGDTVNDYVEVHRIIWTEHNGPIPDKHVVIFKDGDRSNVSIENLMLIDRGDLAVLNKTGLVKAPAELKEAALTTVKIQRKVKQLLEVSN